jgi:inosine/xanthosine triphosphate pyrophosphatase family protein
MNVNGITNTGPPVETNSRIPPIKPVTVEAKETGSDKTGVIYEKATEGEKATTNQTNLIAKLKAESDERTSQFRSLVEKIILKQSATSDNAKNIYSYLATGDFTVDEATKLEAQAEISDNGYWGSAKTSDRIVDFAKALASNNPEKADELKEAFKKGYEQAQETWGGELPEICQETYNLVLEKLGQWSNEASLI